MTVLNDRIDAYARRIAEGRAHEPYTGAAPTYLCGHPRTPENTVGEGPGRPGRCKACKYGRTIGGRYVPVPCAGCGRGVGNGRTGWCEGCGDPTTCLCDHPEPDGLGECGRCHRLVLSHSWHEGRPA